MSLVLCPPIPFDLHFHFVSLVVQAVSGDAMLDPLPIPEFSTVSPGTQDPTSTMERNWNPKNEGRAPTTMQNTMVDPRN